MGALLGQLIFAGLQTLLSTQASLGSINATANLYSINSGQPTSAPLDFSLFQPGFLSQGPGAIGAGIGFGGSTLQPLLFTRTGSTAVWYNPNTTASPGDIVQAFMHSLVR